MNETVTIQCLQEVCFSKSSECSGAGGNIAAGIIVTALIAAAISIIIHLALHIWFYGPRMGKGKRTGAKKKSEEIHEYETIFEDEKKDVVSVKKDVGVQLNSIIKPKKTNYRQ